MSDEHACRFRSVTYSGNVIKWQIVCRCGYEGPLRSYKDQTRLDRLAHKEESAGDSA